MPRESEAEGLPSLVELSCGTRRSSGESLDFGSGPETRVLARVQCLPVLAVVPTWL